MSRTRNIRGRKLSSNKGINHGSVFYLEPAIASIGVTPGVSMRHKSQLKVGFAALAKKGTKKDESITNPQSTIIKNLLV